MNEPSFILIRLEFMTEPIEKLQGFFTRGNVIFFQYLHLNFMVAPGPIHIIIICNLTSVGFFVLGVTKRNFPQICEAFDFLIKMFSVCFYK